MAFDPRAHLRKLPGRKDKNGVQGPPVDYLEVKYRVRWFRDEHPDGKIESNIVEITNERAIFQVTVSIPGSGSATATGNESKVGFADYIGKAETVALGRALATLGYGTEFTDEFEEDKESADPTTYEVNKANSVKRDPPPPMKGASINPQSVTRKAQQVLDAQQPTNGTAGKVTPKQMSTIWAIGKGELRHSEDEIKANVYKLYNVTSMKDMTSEQADDFISILRLEQDNPA